MEILNNALVDPVCSYCNSLYILCTAFDAEWEPLIIQLHNISSKWVTIHKPLVFSE